MNPQGALVQVTAPHFCAGIVFNERNKVISAAPILRWALTKDTEFLKSYFERKGWKAVYVGPVPL